MARTSDTDNDFSSFKLPSASTRVHKPEQVIDRPDRAVETTRKSQGEFNLNQLTDVIIQWPNWDLWPFRLGLPILGLACAGTGYLVNITFRKALYLEHYARVSSYATVMGIPAFSGALMHGMTASADVLQQKSSCPVCVQVRSAVVQLVFGLMVPIISAPLISYSTAAAMKDVYFPNIKKHPKEVWEFTKQTYKPIRGHLGVIAAAQVILAMGMTFVEQECFYTKMLPVIRGEKSATQYPSSNEELFAS